ncbi:hypothetical protein J3Q64DRAFT_1746960 [Phycomyces blakesleeanus]|uniref:Uncharacterized protein n=2 Tax=Phycomyces blakesleeanus TaxID=4837 RepID=A0A163ABF6_PHYB8|nr:hypothetical protein PHYBLDRAFT_65601 [Phycomyces blakesleeanus NRRL 1555(-)]OAD72351.1 hypothetical protein PHYBLDRAFT_65601 [Phycomyces blakesleeanus NRRL 1555(-)]|eukprot:XP_018290391.1 hypothetical protein PHYBLDRAFT_65601 [Phycomyces blakesleeanus NRRL 1555(-)]
MPYVFLLLLFASSVAAFPSTNTRTTAIVICVSTAVFILVIGLVGLVYYLYSQKCKRVSDSVKDSYGLDDPDKESKLYIGQESSSLVEVHSVPSSPTFSIVQTLPGTSAVQTVPSVPSIPTVPIVSAISAVQVELEIPQHIFSDNHPIPAKRRGSTASLLLLGSRFLRPSKPLRTTVESTGVDRCVSHRKTSFGLSCISLLEKRGPKEASVRKKYRRKKMTVNSLRGGMGSWKAACSSLSRKSVASVQWVSFPGLENETQQTLSVVNGESTIGKKRRLHKIPIQTTPKDN